MKISISVRGPRAVTVKRVGAVYLSVGPGDGALYPERGTRNCTCERGQDRKVRCSVPVSGVRCTVPVRELGALLEELGALYLMGLYLIKS